MTRKSVLLLASHWPGLKVCEELRDIGDLIVRLYVSDKTTSLNQQIIAASGLPDSHVFDQKWLLDSAHGEVLAGLAFDFIVSVYWPTLLKPTLLSLARQGTVNFHP